MIFLNINCRLNLLIDRSWDIGYLKAKVFQDGSDPLDHLCDQLEGADLEVY